MAAVAVLPEIDEGILSAIWLSGFPFLQPPQNCVNVLPLESASHRDYPYYIEFLELRTQGLCSAFAGSGQSLFETRDWEREASGGPGARVWRKLSLRDVVGFW